MAILEQFLLSILSFIRAKDAANLQDWLRVEPPLPERYFQLGRELRESYGDSNALERQIAKLLPENSSAKADDGDIWPGFLVFIQEYLEFWRDVNFGDLLATHTQLTGLVRWVAVPRNLR